MFRRIIINNIKSSKLITTATLLIISISALLTSLAIIVGVNLFYSIDTLMTNAKTPHFLQMHSGDINMNRLDNFAKNNDLVDEYQVLDFLNVEGSDIVINKKSLADSIQDNGFTTQSDKFDYLLDLSGNYVTPKDGEIYLPIYFIKDKLAQVGDIVTFKEKKFHVAGFIRDSQMNSPLASSKRFLISKNDYNEIKSFGNLEYLIEFRLKDLSSITTFENQYINANLESNGPTITHSLFKMINAISDGIMIAVILLVSIIILLIAFMCIRFTLLAKIEDDYREIGIMKAIGLNTFDIKKIYILKYALVSAIGCILGFVLSLPLKNILIKNIKISMGESNNGYMAPFISILGVILIFLIIILYVNKILKRFKKISTCDALRFNGTTHKTTSSKHCSINISRLFGANIFLGIKDVLSRKHLYITIAIIMILSTFIVIVPQNLYHTISSRDFISYTGVGNCDMRIDIQQTDNIPKKSQDIESFIKSDKNIDKYSVIYTKSFTVKSNDGSNENIKIDLGDHTIFPVNYTEGKIPTSDNEIALSSINSDELNKKVGDTITLNLDGKEKNLTVCGIYSDITNGGKSAKATFSANLNEILGCMISIKMINEDIKSDEVEIYTKKFKYAKVSHIQEYINQTLDSTKTSIELASYLSKIASILIVALITALFIKMLISKDKYSIAVMKSLGFTNLDISIQYISKAVFVSIIGIIIGTVLANTLGEVLAGALISTLGATVFKFIINPISTYLLCPAMLILSVIIASILSTSNCGKIKISDNIKE